MVPDNGSIVKAVNIISCNGSAVSKSSTNTSIKDKISSLTTTAIDGNGSYGAKTYIYHNQTFPEMVSKHRQVEGALPKHGIIGMTTIVIMKLQEV